MDRYKSIGDLVPEASFVRPPVAIARPIGSQGDLFSADTTWFPVLKTLIRTGTMARLGPYGIAVYLALKARAGLGNGRAVVSIGDVAQDTGMSERAARGAIRKLEDERLILTESAHGRRNIFQLIERLEVVDEGGQTVGIVEWPFSATTWRDHLKKIVAAAASELATGRTQANININIGTLNILVTPGQHRRTDAGYPQAPPSGPATPAPDAEVASFTPAPRAGDDP